MPSKNMLRKGKRRQSVRAEYRVHRDAIRDANQISASTPEGLQPATETPVQPLDILAKRRSSRAVRAFDAEDSDPMLHEPQAQDQACRSFIVPAAANGTRLDAWLPQVVGDLSRSRIQTLIQGQQVTVEGVCSAAKTKLKGGERIEILGEPNLPPLNAEPEDIPLDIVYEDDDLAVINKSAGMMVHAGSGAPEHNRGTLVNALLFHFGKALSGGGDNPIRPGIVHRLDKDTSGLILIAKNDRAHRGLAESFSTRTLRKVYLALVHGWLESDTGTVDLSISRDLVRRTRMTTRRTGGRLALTHWRVLERVVSSFGRFSLLEVRIETGRTHQIRVHMQSLGHPVVGDTLYGAPGVLRPNPHPSSGIAQTRKVIHAPETPALSLHRNFLHAAELQLQHPITGVPLVLSAPLPPELAGFLEQLRAT